MNKKAILLLNSQNSNLMVGSRIFADGCCAVCLIDQFSDSPVTSIGFFFTTRMAEMSCNNCEIKIREN